MKMKHEIDEVIAVTRNLQRIQSDFAQMADITGQADNYKLQRQATFNEIWRFIGVEANAKDETAE